MKPLAVIRSLDERRPHYAGAARCAACDHAWVAVVPETTLSCFECPQCHAMADHAQYARVRNALEVIDDLREKVRSGQVVAFAAVGIEPDDTTVMWSSCTENVSRLRCIGAIAHLLHAYQHGEDTQ